MRQWVALALFAWATPALADARGTSVYQSHCARCHVVGQGAPLKDKQQSFIDITLAARQHDHKWLMSFLQKPTSVSRDSACRTKLNEKDASDVYRFLNARLKPPPAEATASSSVAGTKSNELGLGKVAKENPWTTAPPLPGPKPSGMVHR